MQHINTYVLGPFTQDIKLWADIGYALCSPKLEKNLNAYQYVNIKSKYDILIKWNS